MPLDKSGHDCIWPVESGVPEVGALYVDPEHWRRGAGGTLLTATLNELAQIVRSPP
jgi:GNAT superfamily N-acetyltransferase